MTGGENRRVSILKALRKRRIDNDIYGFLNREHGYYNNLHQYSKNKIHCSCPMCSAKSTKYKGRGLLINYKISDVRKIQKLEYRDE